MLSLPALSFTSIFSHVNASWRFFAALVVGFILVLGATLAAFCLNLGVPTNLSRWAFDLNQKKRALAAQVESPKLLLVGGSGILFGISAREIESQTGYRTINLGVHAGLGTNYILREAQRLTKPGDILLLVLEYELYKSGKVRRTGTDNLMLEYIVSRDPGFFHTLSPMEQWNLFMLTSNQRLLRGLKNRLWPEADPAFGVYNVRSIDRWGDQTHHAKADRGPEQREAVWRGEPDLRNGLPQHPDGFASIESFCSWAHTQHIRVLATYPNLCDRPDYHLPAARQTAEKIRDFFSGLNVPVIGDYTDSLLPAEEFFDSDYHLTEEGALARTDRLIPQLMPFLK